MNDEIGCLIRSYDRYADKLDGLLTSLSDYYTVVGYDAIKKLPPVEAIQKSSTFFISGKPKGKQEGARYYHTNGLWM